MECFFYKKLLNVLRINLLNEKTDNMKKIFAILLLVLPLCMSMEAQVKNPSSEIYLSVDQEPDFPGGEIALYRFIAENAVYPEQARKDAISGQVFVSFIVEKDGSLTGVKVTKGIGGGCDEEVIRLMQMMPNWNPARRHDGKTVRFSHWLSVLFYLGQDNYAQVSYESSEVYVSGYYDPEFPGGEAALNRFLADNQVYPEQARKNAVSGPVFVNFVVEKDGSLTRVKVIGSLGDGCDEEALRVVRLMPKWTPAREHDGKAVRVSYTLPIVFALNNNYKK